MFAGMVVNNVIYLNIKKINLIECRGVLSSKTSTTTFKLFCKKTNYILNDFSGMHMCYKCGKRYRQRYNLNQHCRYECDVEPQFKCQLCVYKTRRKNNLKAHILRKHRNKE